MSLFTPGPWEVEQDKSKNARFWLRGKSANSGDGRLVGTGCIFLGSIGNGGEGKEAIGRAEANARLIAAAPDLLEALRDCEKIMTERHLDDGHVCIRIGLARAAIAKATNGD